MLNAEKCDKGLFSVTIEDLTKWAFGKKQINGLFDISSILGDGKILFKKMQLRRIFYEDFNYNKKCVSRKTTMCN